MAENSSFRSAFKGFNRDDVIAYISELMERISAGEQEMKALREHTLTLERDCAGFQERYDALRGERDALKEDCARLERERDAQAGRCAAPDVRRNCRSASGLSSSRRAEARRSR